MKMDLTYRDRDQTVRVREDGPYKADEDGGTLDVDAVAFLFASVIRKMDYLDIPPFAARLIVILVEFFGDGPDGDEVIQEAFEAMYQAARQVVKADDDRTEAFEQIFRGHQEKMDHERGGR